MEQAGPSHYSRLEASCHPLAPLLLQYLFTLMLSSAWNTTGVNEIVYVNARYCSVVGSKLVIEWPNFLIEFEGGGIVQPHPTSIGSNRLAPVSFSLVLRDRNLLQ